MAAFIALLCFLLILNQSSSLVNASTITETCKRVAANSTKINYDFCIATLSADPGSASADVQGLAVIATKLTKANATSTESTISILLKKTTDSATSQCLTYCSTMYSEIVSMLDDAISYITSKCYLRAYSKLYAVGGNSDICETAFAVAKVKSPLTKEHNDSRKLSGLALTITVLLG